MVTPADYAVATASLVDKEVDSIGLLPHTGSAAGIPSVVSAAVGVPVFSPLVSDVIHGVTIAAGFEGWYREGVQAARMVIAYIEGESGYRDYRHRLDAELRRRRQSRFGRGSRVLSSRKRCWRRRITSSKAARVKARLIRNPGRNRLDGHDIGGTPSRRCRLPGEPALLARYDRRAVEHAGGRRKLKRRMRSQICWIESGQVEGRPARFCFPGRITLRLPPTCQNGCDKVEVK